MVVFLLWEREGVINREGIRPVYGTVQKPVNLTNEQRGIGDVVAGEEASF